MGKQGPCAHCGVTSTPLWRNGPPDKPILCNACGSRWRTRGTLEGYMPLHAGGMGLGAGGSKKFKKTRPPAPRHQSASPSIKRNVLETKVASVRGAKPPQFLKRKQAGRESTQFYMSDDEEVGESRGHFAGKSLGKNEMEGSPGDEWEPSDDDIEGYDEELSREGRRSTGRPMGRSASTGMLIQCSSSMPTQSASRKRTTPVQTRVGTPNSYSGAGVSFPRSLSPSPLPIRRLGAFGGESDGAEEFDEEDLMVHNVSPMVSTEMGLGSLMVRTPSWDTMDSAGNFFSYREERRAMHKVPSVSSLRLGEQPRGHDDGGMRYGTGNREIFERFPYSKRDVLHSPNSPLVHVAMDDIVSCENFYLLFTAEERMGLLQMLAPTDTAQGRSSVASLFQSAQFSAALMNFQKLLQKGMFDSPAPLAFSGLLCPPPAWDEIADDNKQVLSLFQKAASPLFTNLVHSHWWMEWSSLRERVDLKRKLAENEKKKMGPKFDENSFLKQAMMPRSSLGSLAVENPFLGDRIFEVEERMASEMDKLVAENCILNIGTSRGGVEGSAAELGGVGEVSRLFLDVPMVETSALGEGTQGLISTTE